MNSKECIDCKQELDFSEFSKQTARKDGMQRFCKKCAKVRWGGYYEREKERLTQKSKDRYWNGGRESSLAVSKAYHYTNQEKRNKQSREYAEIHKEEIKAKRSTTKDADNKRQRDYSRNRCKTDPLYKFKKNIRRSTSEAFSIGKKSKKTLELLGCSLDEAFAYIQALFQPGMTWDNYGSEWHIDHIVPLASADSIEKAEKLCHYKNLQPLWALENILKSDKMDWKQSSISPV